MEVMVHEMESRVHYTDGQALLHPSILNKITEHVCAKVKESLHHARVVEEERKIRPNLTSREVSFWE
jgi:hypothetical protein